MKEVDYLNYLTNHVQLTISTGQDQSIKPKNVQNTPDKVYK